MTGNQQSGTGVLAIIECGADGTPTIASLEALGASTIIAQSLGGWLDVAMADREGPLRGQLGDGIRRIYKSACAGTDLTDVTWAACQAAHPLAVVLPATVTGRAAAGTISGRLAGEFISGCVSINERAGTLQFGRPCLSGRGFALMAWDHTTPVVVTTEPGSFRVARSGGGPEPEVVALDVPAENRNSGVRVLSEVAPSAEDMDIVDADIVVAGGAGVGDKEGFALLMQLAQKLGGTVAASRVAVDRGWLPASRQVGLTGKIIAPRLYLAFGISGASQHIAGIRSAEKVVAINIDPKAPIFKVADLAVIADLHEIVPSLIERLSESGSKDTEG